MEFFAYQGVFLSNIRVASAAHKASEVDCLLFFLPFFLFSFSVVRSFRWLFFILSFIFGSTILRAASHDSLASKSQEGKD
jgi:hypothetical protein